MNDNLEDLDVDEADGETVLGGVALPEAPAVVGQTEAKATAISDSLMAKKVPGY